MIKGGEAAGLDRVLTKCLNRGTAAIVEFLMRLLNLCFMSDVVPVE